jgi:hypothetical protein
MSAPPACWPPEKEAFRNLEAVATASHFEPLRSGRFDTAETSSLHQYTLRTSALQESRQHERVRLLTEGRKHPVEAAAVQRAGRCSRLVGYAP